jgi:hypothetical protein
MCCIGEVLTLEQGCDENSQACLAFLLKINGGAYLCLGLLLHDNIQTDFGGVVIFCCRPLGCFRL